MKHESGKPNNWLNQFKRNVASQEGEDGISVMEVSSAEDDLSQNPQNHLANSEGRLKRQYRCLEPVIKHHSYRFAQMG